MFSYILYGLTDWLYLLIYLFVRWWVVGTNMGNVMVWDIGSRERIAHRSFKVWDLQVCSVALQVWISKCLFTACFLRHLVTFWLLIPSFLCRRPFPMSTQPQLIVWCGVLMEHFAVCSTKFFLLCFTLIFTEYFLWYFCLLHYIQICMEF